jgi:hypothetical protein
MDIEKDLQNLAVLRANNKGHIIGIFNALDENIQEAICPRCNKSVFINLKRFSSQLMTGRALFEECQESLLTAKFGFEVTENLSNYPSVYQDETTLRVILTGWKGSTVIYEALKFALENDFLTKCAADGVSKEEVQQALHALGGVVD